MLYDFSSAVSSHRSSPFWAMSCIRKVSPTAPSVALGTLGLAFYRHGGDYVAIEGRSMVIGAVALGAYSVTVCQLLMCADWSALRATVAALAIWLVVAVGLKQFLIG
jgi:hypothetical protein